MSGYSSATQSDAHGNVVTQTKDYKTHTESITNTYNAETWKLTNSAIDNGVEKLYNIEYSYDYKGNVKSETCGGTYPLF